MNKLSISIFFAFISCFLYSQTGSVTFQLKVEDSIQTSFKPEGRLLIYMSKSSHRPPRYQSGTTPGTHVFGMNINNWQLSMPITVESDGKWVSTADWDFAEVPRGTYFIQAVWNQSGMEESRTNVPGNIYSEPVEVNVDGNQKVELTMSNIIPERILEDHPLVKYYTVESELLSAFWSKPMKLNVSVLLPSGYDANPNKRYPVRYNVAGYGGRYTRVSGLIRNESFMDWWTSEEAPQVITVFLDGEGPYGDSYQLDSENSGPYGSALIGELIPAIEKEFRIIGDTEHRFVDGCSTGGWVSLALQLFYPDSFNGCYSYSPDPVSFEKMQLVNVYEDENAFYNKFQYLRPSKRNIYGEPEFSIKQEIYDENVQGSSGTFVTSGQQWGSWNALYSPKGEDGLPVAIFDPMTGEVNKEAAKHWEKYDLLKLVKTNWEDIGPRLQGKIFVWMGDMDNYYLNNAMRDFDDFLKDVSNPSSDATILFSPMEGHCSEYSHEAVLKAIDQKVSEK